MDHSVRWGILGTGNMAQQFARGLRQAVGAEVAAIGSRSQERAAAVARQLGVPRSHGNYRALAQDETVDVVYVATPPAMHCEHVLQCLEAGKPVLCEKPLAISAAQAMTMAAAARTRKLFLMEGLWYRFLPLFVKIRELIAAGTIGEVRLVAADLGFNRSAADLERVGDSARGGGCLLDIGIYLISLATMLLGPPEGIVGQATMGTLGTDEQMSCGLRYPGGRLASLYASLRVESPRQAAIVGSRGTLRIDRNWWRGASVSVMTARGNETIEMPAEGNGYQYEAAEVNRCIRTGLPQSTMAPLEESIATLRITDELRQQWGLRYPGEFGERPGQV
jgi:predicted dehydrogenase